ncbi:MAG TPA: hypothetical protein VMT52_13590 [Planctomycetota bacterium]|nr:hypothetical protein [Planctomycetota bacterium]
MTLTTRTTTRTVAPALRLMAITLALLSPSCNPPPPVEPVRDAPAPPVAASPGAAWTCPMHPAIQVPDDAAPCPSCGMKLVPAHGEGAFICVEHAGEGEPGAAAIAPGKCSRCGKDLERARVEAVHDCPVHGGLALPEPGVCPLCGKTLLVKNAALFWKCLEHAGEVRLEEGHACGKCEMTLTRTIVDLPHGDHNPRHGGVFFMAADRWHHVEGTLIEPGVFRLYLYDDFTRPLAAAGARGAVRRVQRSALDGSLEEGAAIPLLPSTNAPFLEAALEGLDLPLEISAFVRFAGEGDGGEPHRFDFYFTSPSPSDAGGGAPRAAAPAASYEAPADRSRALEDLVVRAERTRALLLERRLTELYVPALEAKDIALSLADRGKDAPEAKRGAIERAAAGIVRSAWLLDLHGDAGDFRKASDAHAELQESVERMLETFRQ